MANHNMFMAPEFVNTTEKTFQFQDSLPSLPIPPLENTIKVYLESVRPFATKKELEHTRQLLQDFENGIGKDLQAKLLHKNSFKRNWIEKWWEDKAYLEGRTTIAPFGNFTGPGPELEPDESTQCERAGFAIWYMVKFWELLYKEQIQVEKIGGKVPLDMHQNVRLFNSCRVPGEKIDTLECHFKTETEGKCPSHVVVISRGHFFVFDTLDDDGEQFTMPELQKQIEYIVDICKDRPYGPGIGALTSLDRTLWAQLRQHLIDLHPENQENLRLIETCFFTGSMEDTAAPVTRTERVYVGLGGEPRDRWFDKPIHLIVFKNGLFTYNCDHAPFDALTPLASCQLMYRGIKVHGAKWQGSKHVRNLPKPKEMVWHTDQRITEAVEAATKKFHANMSTIELYTPVFEGFGKKYLKKLRVHPDSFVQLAIQLSYYKMYKKPAATYETATARLFYHGRTETVRSCTMETLEWSKVMVDPKSSVTKKLALLGKAYQKQQQLMAEAMQYRGCDRHLLGLYCVALEEGIPVPEIFTDPLFTRSGGGGNFTLSTSCSGFYPLHGGLAAMCPGGYGCFYSFQDDTIMPFLSCWTTDENTSCHKFYETLKDSFYEMVHLLETQSQTDKSAKL